MQDLPQAYVPVRSDFCGLSSIGLLHFFSEKALILAAKGISDTNPSKPIYITACNISSAPVHVQKHMSISTSSNPPSNLIYFLDARRTTKVFNFVYTATKTNFWLTNPSTSD